jgi:hypothetical protein
VEPEPLEEEEADEPGETVAGLTTDVDDEFESD